MSASKDHLSLSFLSRARFYFREALQLDLAKVDWSVAFRNSLGIGLTVIFGILFLPHDQALALIVGALQTSAYDNSDSYQVRARRLLLTSLFGGIAVLCAGLASPMAGLTSVLLVGFGFFTGMMWSLGTEAADLSIITLVTFAIFAATPMTTSGTLVLSFSVLVGGLIQSALSISLWWFRRFRPESRALGVYFQELSLLTQIAIDLDDVPPASAASIRAHEILSSISRDPRDAGSRYRSLLSQAEMARVSILNLVRLRGRLVRQPEQAELVRELDAFLRHCCQTLVEIAESLKGGAKFQSDLTFSCDSISNLSLRKRCRQLESALHASQSIVASLRGHRQVRRRAHTSRRALRLRFFDPIESLRANLNFSSSIFRHACRLSVCLLIGEIIKNQFTLNRSYWLSMTILLVLRPAFASTVGRGFLRIAGTLVGLLIATAVLYLMPLTEWNQIAVIMVFAFTARSVGVANYGLFTVGISGLIVLLFSLVGVDALQVVAARVINTALGGGLAVVSYWLWPATEKGNLHRELCELVGSYRAYFAAVAAIKCRSNQKSDLEHEADRWLLDDKRLRGRAARFNFKTTVARTIHERSVSDETRSVLTGILASSNRFSHSVMDFEAAQMAADESFSNAPFARAAIVKIDSILHEVETALLTGSKLSVSSEFEDLNRQPALNDASVWREHDEMINSLETLCGYLKTWLAMRNDESKLRSFS